MSRYVLPFPDLQTVKDMVAQEITKAYGKVIDLLKINLAKAKTDHATNHDTNEGSVTATTQDILILLLPHLTPTDATALFQLCLSSEVLGGNDNGVQKRGYKILTKLAESGKVPVNAETVVCQLDQLADALTPAAKKVSDTGVFIARILTSILQDRFNLLSLLIPMIPSTAMQIVLSIIPEAVLGTKEPSEKARSAAFDVIVAMGRKMSEGGVVKRNMVDGMDEDGVSGESLSIVLSLNDILIR